jgi:hypothetical protein
MYYQKYLKYKNKYLDLQSKIGGGKYDNIECKTIKNIFNRSTCYVEKRQCDMIPEIFFRDKKKCKHLTPDDKSQAQAHAPAPARAHAPAHAPARTQSQAPKPARAQSQAQAPAPVPARAHAPKPAHAQSQAQAQAHAQSQAKAPAPAHAPAQPAINNLVSEENVVSEENLKKPIYLTITSYEWDNLYIYPAELTNLERQILLDPKDHKERREQINITDTTTKVYQFREKIEDNILDRIKILLASEQPENQQSKQELIKILNSDKPHIINLNLFRKLNHYGLY